MRFEVDFGLLDRTASNLKDAVEVARQVAEGRAGLASIDAGSDKLGSAIEGFADEWGYGMELIRDDADKLAQNLGAGADAYRNTENGTAEAFGG